MRYLIKDFNLAVNVQIPSVIAACFLLLTRHICFIFLIRDEDKSMMRSLTAISVIVICLNSGVMAESTAPVLIDDGSHLNQTTVFKLVDIHTEEDVKNALAEAHKLGKHISIAGAQHSMGGQTFDQDNIVLNMLPFNTMSYASQTDVLTVQSGARWAQVQAFLDPKGRSVWVMQSDNVFSVGGTLSVNAHGWQPRQGPIASTVESFRIMLASGEIKTCSRTENPPLFHAALGGYGLFGVILDVRLHTVPNKLYRQESYFFPLTNYGTMFQKYVAENPRVELAYGRLSVDRRHFLTEASLHTFEEVSPQPASLPSMEPEQMVHMKQMIFLDTAGHESRKLRRWVLEKQLTLHQRGRLVTRNSVMDENVRVEWNPRPDSRAILQEYFVSYSTMDALIAGLRELVPRYHQDLLNVTLRDVRKDDDTILAYAKGDVCAFVLFFSQKPTPEAETRMQEFTVAMLDRVQALGGSFYLPYRLHYSVSQFHMAYPNAQEFLQIKRQYDPQELFTSRFFRYISSQP